MVIPLKLKENHVVISVILRWPVTTEKAFKNNEVPQLPPVRVFGEFVADHSRSAVG